MKKEEGIMKEMFASKLVKAATDIFFAELEAIKEEKKAEEDPVTLRIQYEAERDEAITIPQSSLCDIKDGYLYIHHPEDLYDFTWGIAMRTTGLLAKKAFLLNEEYDWKIGRDEESRLCLLPIKKEK